MNANAERQNPYEILSLNEDTECESDRKRYTRTEFTNDDDVIRGEFRQMEDEGWYSRNATKLHSFSLFCRVSSHRLDCVFAL